MSLVGNNSCDSNRTYGEGYQEGCVKGRKDGFTQGVLYHAAYDTAIVTLRKLDICCIPLIFPNDILFRFFIFSFSL